MEYKRPSELNLTNKCNFLYINNRKIFDKAPYYSRHRNFPEEFDSFTDYCCGSSVPLTSKWTVLSPILGESSTSSKPSVGHRAPEERQRPRSMSPSDPDKSGAELGWSGQWWQSVFSWALQWKLGLLGGLISAKSTKATAKKRHITQAIAELHSFPSTKQCQTTTIV